MTDEQIQTLLETRWQYSRKEERKRWVKDPDRFADYMASSAVRGHAFLRLSPEAKAQVVVDREKARQAALEFIKGRKP